jgi:hypothetical protein
MKSMFVLDALVASGIVGLGTAARAEGRFVGDYARSVATAPMRAQPEPAAPAVGIIPPGVDRIYVQRVVARPTLCGGAWMKVRYDGRWGWVNAALLRGARDPLL